MFSIRGENLDYRHATLRVELVSLGSAVIPLDLESPKIKTLEGPHVEGLKRHVLVVHLQRHLPSLRGQLVEDTGVGSVDVTEDVDSAGFAVDGAVVPSAMEVLEGGLSPGYTHLVPVGIDADERGLRCSLVR